MNNHHHMSKRKRQAVLFFTYGFMSLAVLVISTVCILLIMGYRFDFGDRSIEQGALLQFRSTPADAQIVLNEKLLNFNTPGKLDVAVGTHTVKMQKEDYHDWSKTITVKAGELRWLNYARLIPTKIENTTPLKFTGAVSNALQTPDRQYVAVVTDPAQPIVQIVDLRNETNIVSRSVTIPSTELTLTPGQASQFTITEWDFGSRYLLVLHRSGEVTEYIRIDRSNDTGAARNITKEFNLAFQDMHFSGTSGNTLYALTGKDLRKIDTGAGSVSQPLVGDVEQYQLYRENDIAFVALRADKRVAGVYLDDEESIVRSVAADQPMLADVSRYYSNYYFAVTTPEGVDVIKDPAETNQASTRVHAQLKTAGHDKTWLNFASSGRFILAGTTGAYSVYDLETEESYTVQEAVTSSPTVPPQWLDDFSIVSTLAGKVRVFDYDGLNAHDITASKANLPAFLSDNGTYLYSFVDNAGITSLQSTRLILE
jgi:hypothetical protein